MSNGCATSEGINRAQLGDDAGLDFEGEVLKAGGFGDPEQIAAYRTRLEQILHSFRISEQGSLPEPFDFSQRLFQWLWDRKPNRYLRGGPFLLQEVIDRQLDNGPGPVGNCLGLTLLFNCLLNRVRVSVCAVYVENAFGFGGPHVLSRLTTHSQALDVEHLCPRGFGFREHLQDSSREIWGKKDLLADVFHSMGNTYFLKRQGEEALRCYERALELNPRHQRAQLNRIMMLNAN